MPRLSFPASTRASANLMQHAPWLMLFPGLTIMLGILGFNLTGDALRDILDPRTERRTA